MRRPDPDRTGQRPLEYDRPELMALGDSLYNGVQSLRVNWFLSEWSAPTTVAIALGTVDPEFLLGGRRAGAGDPDRPDYGYALANSRGANLFQDENGIRRVTDRMLAKL